MGRKNGTQTVRFQVSVDEVTDKILDDLVVAGVPGRNKPDVASWIIREWIWHHPEELARANTSIKKHITNNDS